MKSSKFFSDHELKPINTALGWNYGLLVRRVFAIQDWSVEFVIDSNLLPSLHKLKNGSSRRSWSFVCPVERINHTQLTLTCGLAWVFLVKTVRLVSRQITYLVSSNSAFAEKHRIIHQWFFSEHSLFQRICKYCRHFLDQSYQVLRSIFIIHRLCFHGSLYRKASLLSSSHILWNSSIRCIFNRCAYA